jgi:hypothetical protein
MEFEGKYKDWYYRLVKANYGEEKAKGRIKKFIEQDQDEYWNKMIQNRIEKFKEEPNEARRKVEIIREKAVGDDRWEKAVQAVEEGRKLELEMLDKAIPKEELEDGAWYRCNEKAEIFTRHCDRAQWIAEKDYFRVPGQQQFGMDGYLDHWVDAIDTGYAGFIPMWKEEV